MYPHRNVYHHVFSFPVEHDGGGLCKGDKYRTGRHLVEDRECDGIQDRLPSRSKMLFCLEGAPEPRAYHAAAEWRQQLVLFGGEAKHPSRKPNQGPGIRAREDAPSRCAAPSVATRRPWQSLQPLAVPALLSV